MNPSESAILSVGSSELDSVWETDEFTSSGDLEPIDGGSIIYDHVPFDSGQRLFTHYQQPYSEPETKRQFMDQRDSPCSFSLPGPLYSPSRDGPVSLQSPLKRPRHSEQLSPGKVEMCQFCTKKNRKHFKRCILCRYEMPRSAQKAPRPEWLTTPPHRRHQRHEKKG